MSVQKRNDGKYEVRWREGGRQRSRLFNRKGDADAFDRDVKRRKQLGTLAPSVLESRVTLAEFVAEDWWPRYAIPNLSENTRDTYLAVWGKHLLPRVGDYELREFTPMLVEDLRIQFDRADVGAPTQRKALILLQGIMGRAVMRGLIPANPVSVVPKPRQRTTRTPQPLAPLTVERIVAQLDQRDAIITKLIAYAGLRPGEDTGTRWGDIEGRALLVYASKTRRERRVRLLDPLAQDLAEWRLACGRPPDSALIVPTRDGDEWKRHDWQNWRRRIYQPAASAAGVTGDLRPYRLRGSFVSLLLWEGRSLAYVSKQAGHSIATLAKHYAGVIEELEDQPRIPASDAIRKAREEVSCAKFVRNAPGVSS
jgi:integrase